MKVKAPERPVNFSYGSTIQRQGSMNSVQDFNDFQIRDSNAHLIKGYKEMIGRTENLNP